MIEAVKKSNFNPRNRAFVVIIILLAYILTLAIISTDKHNSTKANKTSGSNTGNTNIPRPVADTGQHKFSSGIYERIKSGMSQEQVQQLLNLHSPECSHTDAEPSITICTWVDGDKSITVNFGTIDSVTAKYKTGF